MVIGHSAEGYIQMTPRLVNLTGNQLFSASNGSQFSTYWSAMLDTWLLCWNCTMTGSVFMLARLCHSLSSTQRPLGCSGDWWLTANQQNISPHWHWPLTVFQLLLSLPSQRAEGVRTRREAAPATLLRRAGPFTNILPSGDLYHHHHHHLHDPVLHLQIPLRSLYQW